MAFFKLIWQRQGGLKAPQKVGLKTAINNRINYSFLFLEKKTFDFSCRAIGQNARLLLKLSKFESR